MQFIVWTADGFWFYVLIYFQSDLDNQCVSIKKKYKKNSPSHKYQCYKSKNVPAVRAIGQCDFKCKFTRINHFNALCMLIEVLFLFIYCIFYSRSLNFFMCIDFTRSHYHLHWHQKAYYTYTFDCVMCDILFCEILFVFLAKFGGTLA